MISEISSCGLYSTWLYLPTINTLMDCGEGVTSRLKNRCFGIQRLLISHDHTDHISGLDILINVRNLGFGTKETPLEIYHPETAPNLKELRQYIQKTQPNLKYPITWKTLQPGLVIPVNKSQFIRAFQVEHGSTNAYGFAVTESRSKLKAQYQHLGETELTKMGREGIKLTEPYEKKLLVYSGDCWKIPKEEVDGTDYLFLDTTFLTNTDRDNDVEGNKRERKYNPTHASLEENLKFLKHVKVHKTVFFHHLSPRYNPTDIQKAQSKLPQKYRILNPGQINLINPTNSKQKPQAPNKPAQPPKKKQESSIEP